MLVGGGETQKRSTRTPSETEESRRASRTLVAPGHSSLGQGFVPGDFGARNEVRHGASRMALNSVLTARQFPTSLWKSRMKENNSSIGWRIDLSALLSARYVRVATLAYVGRECKGDVMDNEGGTKVKGGLDEKEYIDEVELTTSRQNNALLG